MKIAVVQDELVRKGGAEQVCLSFMKAFPEADLYTSSYNEELTYPEFKAYKIKTSWFNSIGTNEVNLKRFFYPFAIWAMQSLDLSDYDVVLIGGTNSGKYVKKSKKALVINYCYTPFRLAWNPESYSEYLNATALKRVAYDFVIRRLKSVDSRHAKNVSHFLAMTEETKERIIKAYSPIKPIEIIPPPVKVSDFEISSGLKDYYLLVSRLEHYKKVDLAIEAFNQLNYKLIIVGKGSKSEELQRLANNNIEFRSNIPIDELSNLYSGCKAFIFPQHEDYGITPLEANSAGRPVIAYKAGGVLTTQIDADIDSEFGTAIFFDDQSVDSLVTAVKHFEEIFERFQPAKILLNTKRFEEKMFISKVIEYVNRKYLEHTQESI